jgi:hypothetical protein
MDPILLPKSTGQNSIRLFKLLTLQEDLIEIATILLTSDQRLQTRQTAKR